MFSGDWFKRHSALIAGVGGGLLLLSFLIYSFVEQAGYNQYSQSEAANYAGYAAEEQKHACIGVASPKLAECRAKAQTEYDLKANAGDRDYSDLIAQRKSALWAMIMAIAALIGMVLSVIGVILVKRTFDETQRTNRLAMRDRASASRRAVHSATETATALEIAKRNAEIAAEQVRISEDTARHQLRAYVGIKGFKTTTILTNNGDFLKLTIEWQNTGSTPAHKVMHFVDVKAFGMGDDVGFPAPRRGSISVSAIAPQQSINVTDGRNISLDNIWNDREKAILLHGAGLNIPTFFRNPNAEEQNSVLRLLPKKHPRAGKLGSERSTSTMGWMRVACISHAPKTALITRRLRRSCNSYIMPLYPMKFVKLRRHFPQFCVPLR